MIWSATLDREEFLSFGQGKQPDFLSVTRIESLQDLSLRARTRTGKYIFIWPTEPVAKQLPRAVLVDPVDEEDFYSFVGAFLPNLSPITAQIRVFNVKTLVDYFVRRDSKESNKLTEAAVGLVLCEAAARMDQSNETVTFRTCAATHGFALGRHLAQGFDTSLLQKVSAAWHTARGVCGEQKTRFARSDLTIPWDALGHLSRESYTDSGGVPDEILFVCRSLLNQGEATAATLVRLFPHSGPILTSLGGTREDKVQTLERYVSEVTNSEHAGRESTMISFILGLLCSEISRGTLEHLPLLHTVANKYPAALLWYGVCAGLRRQGGVFSSMKGLGRLVLREMLRAPGPLDVPSCDIALGELLVLIRGRGKFPDIVTSSATYADIEVMPFVTSSFSVPGRRENGRKEANAETPQALDRSAIARRIRVVVDALENLENELSGREQMLPFDKKQHRRERRR